MLIHLTFFYYFISLLSGAAVFSLLMFFSLRTRNRTLIYYLVFYCFISIKIFSWIISTYFGIMRISIPPILYYPINEFSIFCVIWSLPLFFHSLFDVPFRRIANVLFVGTALFFIIQDLILWMGGGTQNDADASTLFFGSVLVAVILYCLIIGLIYYKHLKSRLSKRIVKTFLILSIIFLPGFVWDSILIMYNQIMLTPLFYLLWNLLTIYFGLRYLLATKEKIQINQSFLNEYDFTKREIEILDLMLQGFSYKKMGEKAFISAATVKTHLHNIYAKTGVKTRHEFMALFSHYKDS